MANDTDNLVTSFTDILWDNYQPQLIEEDVSAILIDMLTNEDLIRDIIKTFKRQCDFLQFFIYYFKNIGGMEFSLASVFSNVLEGKYKYAEEWLYRGGKYTFEKKIDLSPNYFKGVEKIPANAFSYWFGLNKVTLSNDVKIIGNDAFSYCNSLTSIEIPNSVTRIGDYVFYRCNSLTSVTIPESVSRMGMYVFDECESLESAVILGKLKSIPAWTFKRCSKLTNVSIPKYVKIINGWAFQECNSLKTIALPNGLKSIGDGAFLDCTYLTNLVIPDSVTKIGDDAFCYCTSLKSLRLPSKLEEIGAFIFVHCEDTLNDVSYNGTKEQWQQIGKSRFWYDNWASYDKPKEIKCTDGIIRSNQF